MAYAYWKELRSSAKAGEPLYQVKWLRYHNIENMGVIQCSGLKSGINR